MSVPEPDSLISNGLIIVRALLLPSLKKNKTKKLSKLISCIIITGIGMRLSVYLLARVCDSSCAHHYV